MKIACSNRRTFILGVSSLAFSPLLGHEDAMPPLLRFGVVSDIHITYRGLKNRCYEYGSAHTFVHALEYFKSRGVHAVVVPGDLADRGIPANLDVVANAWREVFPEDDMPRVFIYGNHDADVLWFDRCSGLLKDKSAEEQASLRASCIARNEASCWRRSFHEEWMPVGMKTVNGYHFVYCNWGHEKDVPAFLSRHERELSGSKPFFYVQHRHLRGTLYGGAPCDADDGTVAKVLKAFPNAVTFSGHSHISLTVPNSCCRGDFLSIGTSSLSYLSSFGRPKGAGRDGREGMLVSVYADEIVVERREFVRDESLGLDWHIPISNAATVEKS